jgi:outer membrane protein assembly factor BamB
MYSGDNAAIKILAARSDQINDGTPPGFGGKQFSAFDKTTGELLWTTELEAGATGAPMTYMHRGKQHAVFAIGGQQHAAEFVAFALP